MVFLPEIQLAIAAEARLLWATDFKEYGQLCVLQGSSRHE